MPPSAAPSIPLMMNLHVAYPSIHLYFPLVASEQLQAAVVLRYYTCISFSSSDISSILRTIRSHDVRGMI